MAQYQIRAAAQGLYTVQRDGLTIAKIANTRGVWTLYAVDEYGQMLGDGRKDVTHILHHDDQLQPAIAAFFAADYHPTGA